MKEYIVIKDILNIRSKPSDKDDNSFIGQLLRGDTVWLDEAEIIGDIPKGGVSNIWKPLDSARLVAKDGVKELSWEAKKELLIQDVKKIWEKSKGANISIALLDTGIMRNHPNLPFSIEHILIEGVDNNLRNHGTEMAGFLIGRKDNFVIGFSPEAQILDYKIFNNPIDENTPKFLRDALKLIVQNNSVQVINLSIEFKDEDVIEFRDEIDILINKCIQNGKIIIAATGNSPGSIRYPGSNGQVITVGVIKDNDAPNFKELISENIKRNPDCFIEMNDWTFCRSHEPFIELSSDIASSEVTAVLSATIALKKSLDIQLNQDDIRTLIKNNSTLFTQKKDINILKLNLSNFLNS